MELIKIIKKIDVISVINQQQINISSVCYNSKDCKLDSLFVAIKGECFDGNIFIADAVNNGAKVIVSSDLTNVNIDENITYILVKDDRIALSVISHLFYDNPANELICIGITGTNGKTTTAALVKSILETAGKKVGLIGTTGVFYNDKIVNTEHTTPEALELAKIFREMVSEGIEYLVMEVSSHSIALQRILGIPFKIAAFTNLTTEHLDFHKTMEEYANTKKKLFDNLPQNSIAIVNADDSYSQKMIENCKCIVKGVGEKSLDYKISNVIVKKNNSCFVINDKITINTKLTAYFNIQNAALSYVICNELGVDTESIVRGLFNSTGAAGRLQSVIVNSGATAFIDYAHTPDALEKALLSCKELVSSGKLICLFGCGGDRDKTKRPKMGAIAEKVADVIIITDDNPRTEQSTSIINDILAGVIDKNSVKIIANRKEAIKYAVTMSSSDDIILIAGKGHENYQIIGKQKYHFSDLEEVLC